MPRASLFRGWMKTEISAAVFLAAWMTPSAAIAQPTELPGLGTEALVVEDSDGIPHICSGSVRDTYFMQGYVHARDRFFQMDTLRRTFSGTLAEILGPGALGSDVELRTLGLRRAAEASFAAFQASGLDESLEMLAAYTAGVNAYLAGHPPTIPTTCRSRPPTRSPTASRRRSGASSAAS